MGTQCEGVFANITFQLYDKVTYSYLIDQTVNETINLLYSESIWMQQSCVASFRKHTCMLTLSNITTTQSQMGFGTPYLYCKSDCEYLGEGCDGYTYIITVCPYLSSFTFWKSSLSSFAFSDSLSWCGGPIICSLYEASWWQSSMLSWILSYNSRNGASMPTSFLDSGQCFLW